VLTGFGPIPTPTPEISQHVTAAGVAGGQHVTLCRVGVMATCFGLVVGLALYGAAWWVLGVSLLFGVLNWYIHFRDRRSTTEDP
jgi:hypothetical protein